MSRDSDVPFVAAWAHAQADPQARQSLPAYLVQIPALQLPDSRIRHARRREDPPGPRPHILGSRIRLDPWLGSIRRQIGVVKPEVPSIKEAVSKFLHDLEHGQRQTAATLSKHKNLLEKRLLPWCEDREYRLLEQFDVTAVREFREI